MGGILCYFNKDWCDKIESHRRSSTRKRSPHHLPHHLPHQPHQPSPSRLQKQLDYAFPALGIQIMKSPTNSLNTSPVMLPPAAPYIKNIHNGRSTLKHRSTSPHRISPQRSTRRR